MDLQAMDQEYTLLSVDELVTPFNKCAIYIDRGSEFICFRDADHPVTAEDFSQLKEDGRQFVYVTQEDFHKVQSFRLSASNKSIKKMIDLQEGHRGGFEKAFKSGTDETIEYCNELGISLSDIIQDDPIIAREMFSILCHDNATYTHCLNVAIYSGLLAKERLELQNHPLAGYNILLQRGDGSTWGRMMMVYQHHERINGSGYPVGIIGEEIHPWAKICSITDVFHALTSHRPYRELMSLEQACDYLTEQATKYAAFDEEFVQCWKETMTATTA